MREQRQESWLRGPKDSHKAYVYAFHVLIVAGYLVQSYFYNQMMEKVFGTEDGGQSAVVWTCVTFVVPTLVQDACMLVNDLLITHWLEKFIAVCELTLNGWPNIVDKGGRTCIVDIFIVRTNTNNSSPPRPPKRLYNIFYILLRQD